MWNPPLVFWDLDGTLTDPAVGITSAVQYALQAFGIDEQNRSKLYRFIGPPLKDSFQQFYQFTEQAAERAVARYREYFSQKGIFQNQVYPGIAELLSFINQHGCICMLATSKPTVFAKQILEHFRLSPFFTFVAGSELDGSRVHKEDVLRFALQHAGPHTAREAVLIGDRSFDVLGAHAVGMPCIGVTYGYGSREELEEAGADTIVDSVEELRALFENKNKEQESQV